MSFLPRSLFKERAGQAGFSLIEAMVAIAIFTIGILGCYKMQLHSTHSNAMGERVSTSAHWAMYAIEEILGQEYDDDVFDDVHPPGAPYSGSAGLDEFDDNADGVHNADGVLYIQPDGSKKTAPTGKDLYSVSWNVAEGTSSDLTILRGVKQVRVHVVRKGGIGTGHLYSHDYYKTEEF